MLVAWTTTEGRGCWARLHSTGSLDWVRELPFPPVAFAVVGGRPVFLTDDHGTSLCHAPEMTCRPVSSLHRYGFVFGPEGLLVDHEGGFMIARADDDFSPRPDVGPDPFRTYDPGLTHQRAGPCGSRWVVATVDGLVRLGASTPETMPPPMQPWPPWRYGLLSTGGHTFAYDPRHGLAIDLCTDRRLRAPRQGAGLSPRLIAAFEGARGIGLLRRGLQDDERWYQYDYAGQQERYFWSRGYDDLETRILPHAALDQTGRLWLVTQVGPTLSIEIRIGAPDGPR